MKKTKKLVKTYAGGKPNYCDEPEDWLRRELQPSLDDLLNDIESLDVRANDKQVGGSHYNNKAIQPWDYISQNNLGYLEGCIIKYVSRYQEKNGVEDLEKAKHFLDKLIEVTNERVQKTSASKNQTSKYKAG